MERGLSGRTEALVEINGVDFADTLHEKHQVLGARRTEFIDWVRTQLEDRIPSSVRHPRARANLLQYLLQVEMTFTWEDWADRWISAFAGLNRAPAANIEAMVAKYAHIAGDAEWGEDPLPETKPCPTVHDIIQRGFKAQNEGDGEAQILDELRDFISNGGDLDQRDNSRLTPLARCKMLGWHNGRTILEQATAVA